MLLRSAIQVWIGKSCMPASPERCSTMSVNSRPSISLTWVWIDCEIEEDSLPLVYALEPAQVDANYRRYQPSDQCPDHYSGLLARKASSFPLGLQRIDYPAVDPPEWKKYITIKQENGKVKTGNLPMTFWGNMKQQYEARNKDYTGVIKNKSKVNSGTEPGKIQVFSLSPDQDNTWSGLENILPVK